MSHLFGRPDLEDGRGGAPVSMRLLRKRHGEKDVKVHIRVEENGGQILVNGSLVVHMNGTAAFILMEHARGRGTAEIVRAIKKRFKVGRAIASEHVEEMLGELETVTSGALVDERMQDDAAQAMHQGARLSRTSPLSISTEAPYRVDCALNSAKMERGMGLSQWRRVIDRLWEIGVPHVFFTGVEPTRHKDLVAIIEHADSKGMYVGMHTNGDRLDARFVRRLQNSGLDYLQLHVASMDPALHAGIVGGNTLDTCIEAIGTMVEKEMDFLVHVPVASETVLEAPRLVSRLMPAGVTRFSMDHMPGVKRPATDIQLEDALRSSIEVAGLEARMSYFSPPPLPLEAGKRKDDDMDDLALGIYEWGAGRASLFCDPRGRMAVDGRHPAVLGKLVEDKWANIWYHPMCNDARGKSVKDRRWKVFGEMGLYGYPLYPDLL